MNNGLKLLLMAAGAIVTCIVVVVGFQLTKSGKSDTNQAMEQYTNVNSEFNEVVLTAYDGLTVSGSEVVNCMKENETILVNGVIKIDVVTKEGSTETYSKDFKSKLEQNIAENNKTKANYINPTGNFTGVVSKNANGIVEKLTFTQK